MNDWWGFGFLDAMTDPDQATHGWQFCGRRACQDQYLAGFRCGAETRLRAAVK